MMLLCYSDVNVISCSCVIASADERVDIGGMLLQRATGSLGAIDRTC